MVFFGSKIIFGTTKKIYFELFSNLKFFIVFLEGPFTHGGIGADSESVSNEFNP